MDLKFKFDEEFNTDNYHQEYENVSMEVKVEIDGAHVTDKDFKELRDHVEAIKTLVKKYGIKTTKDA